jgi:hypothetical protein
MLIFLRVPKNLAAPIPEILTALKREVRNESRNGTGQKNRFNSNE